MQTSSNSLDVVGCLVGWEAVSKTVAGDEPVAGSNPVSTAKIEEQGRRYPFGSCSTGQPGQLPDKDVTFLHGHMV